MGIFVKITVIFDKETHGDHVNTYTDEINVLTSLNDKVLKFVSIQFVVLELRSMVYSVP